MSVSSSPTASSNDASPDTDVKSGSNSTDSGATTNGTSDTINDDNDVDVDDDGDKDLKSNTSSIRKQSYQTTRHLLQTKPVFLAPITSVVGLRPAVQDPPLQEEDIVVPSLLTPNRGHHALFRALEDLEGLDKQEGELLLQNPLTAELTTVVTGEDYASPRRAVDTLEMLCRTVPRRVCQHPFKKNDIVWVCRTCQADETCVLCHNCFTQSDHEGHDVAFYHAQAGGCCDCGDPDAWDPRGFCPHHGPASLNLSSSEGGGANGASNLGPLNASVLARVEGVVPATIDWMVENIAKAAEDGYARTDEQPHAMTDDQEGDEQQDPLLLSTSSRTASVAIGTTSPPEAAGNVLALDVDVDVDDGHSMLDNDASPMVLDDDESISTTNAVFSPAAAGSSTRVRLGLVTQASYGSGSVAPVIVPEPHHQLLLDPPQPGQLLQQQQELTKAERLGILAREGGGLYLVLKSDDIHTSPQLVDALRDLLGTSSLYTESILQKVVRALKQFGQLVVWGTMELLAELSLTQVQLWLDGDRVASGVLGRAMLNRSNLLTSHGLFCCILTREELQLEQRAVAVLQWLTNLARSCDPLCQKVAESISPDKHLVPLLRADFKLSSRVTKYWHSLLLTLLAVPAFKSHLAAAYCDTYQLVTAEYARGMGVLERSGYALSVQFLNRVTYVVDLVQRRDLLGKLGASLYQTLRVAAAPIWKTLLQQQPNPNSNQNQNPSPQKRHRILRLNPNHFVLTHRRYSPCISDLKCVLNVKGMPRLFGSKSGSFLNDWIASLALGQMMDPQIWRNWNEDHVEVEVRGWVGAFNASISLGSLFERLLSWDDDDESLIQDPHSPLSKNLMSCVELTLHVLVAGVNEWQTIEMQTHEPTSFSASIEPYKRRSASLSFSTISVKHGSVLAFQAIPMSQDTPFSFHLPLHRFVATCLRETCLRKSGMVDLKHQLAQNLPVTVYETLFLGLMEFPLLVLSRAAQIRAGLWRRNGNGLNDQVLNYAEPPFCRAMRDADLLLVQFAVLGRTKNQTTDYRPETDVGVCFMVHLMVHRLGLFDFCGLAKAPDVDINRYLDEVQRGLYNSEKSSEETGDDFLLPWTYTPASDAASCLLLLEEFLHTMIVLCTELPPIPPSDKVDHTSQAKWRLKREVIHRLASGPKTHSELAEVHHVLSHWDNVYLSEEGKLVNPDDATGAALGAVLSEVASRKVSRGKMEPDKWELSRAAWESYDPSFYHINLRNHQTAAESRPNLESADKELFRVKAKPLSPPLPVAHQDFIRLRRDITSDSTILAIAYRTLHMHIRDTKKQKDVSGVRGSLAYEGEDRSETAVARAVHLLTLGAFAWQDATGSNKEWRNEGGGSVGSVFFDRSDDALAPTAKEWISASLLVNPRTQQASEWYEGEDNCLQLLRQLAVEGGYEGCFVAQDRAVQAGAAWLCEFAANHNSEASKLVFLKADANGIDDDSKIETEAEKRRRIAKQKAMDRMKAQAAKFALMMQTEMGGNDEDEATAHDETSATPAIQQRQVDRQSSFASGSSVASASDSDKAAFLVATDATQAAFTEALIPSRLLKTRPQCIICSDDGSSESRLRDREEDGHRKSRRRRNDGGNALAFVGYTQASTVMKGGGGPPSSRNVYSSTTRFVGAHIALCGHAIHSECWESYLATVSHREDRVVGKRDDLRCPLCQRLSNCLVPFIDVGVDWIEYEKSESSSTEMELKGSKSEDRLDSMSIESQEAGPVSLEEFLTLTPWWVCRHNNGVSWDGQCAFIGNHVESMGNDDQSMKNADHMEEMSMTPTTSVPRRRSVRALRKKDLYAAWNAMMKTPRFVRRKLRPKADPSSDSAITFGESTEIVGGQPVSFSSESSGETVVWRRFMDHVSDITYRADGKRLGDENLHNDFGEFRHYIAEKYTYNMANRFAGKEPSDWPSCVFPYPLSETQRQELSREKLLSKLMMSVQAFTYSVACEANEARRLSQKLHKLSGKTTGLASSESSLQSIFSQYGISNIVCDGRLIVMPRPSAAEDDGSQPFSGRLGRLRYIGLAVMAAAGALAADIVQLALAFPTQQTSNVLIQPFRAPIVYPILHGHILTHVVAAICASAGRTRAMSDSLELVWPIPFSSKGSFIASDNFGFQMTSDSVFDDADGFIKLGLLARIQQVLLGQLDLEGLALVSGLDADSIGLATMKRMRADVVKTSSLESVWKLNCLTLLEVALSKHTIAVGIPESPHVESAIADRFYKGYALAAEAACCYLADIGVVSQLVLPGMMVRYPTVPIDDGSQDSRRNTYYTLNELEKAFRLEPLSEILKSDSVHLVVSNWYKTAREFSKAAFLPGATISGSGAAVSSRLFQTQGFRVFDWPMESTSDSNSSERSGGDAGGAPKSSADDNTETYSMQIDPIQPATPQGGSLAGIRPQLPSPLVTFSSKKSVKLIGGYSLEISLKGNGRPRIARLPASYTDLYAELSRLLPESEQTAVCLVCGEVLNAAGKGECTKHSYKCGAGTGLFFLLQECAGLIMHNGKAAYIHSPYVDSHGETPQYRGRPLNLDLDRYAHLHEVWSGHTIRQQVLAERGSSRQIIVPDFY